MPDVSQFRQHVAPNASVQTIWRALKRLVEEGHLETTGQSRGTGYILAGPSVIRAHLTEHYNRRDPTFHNREFIDHYLPNKTFYLSNLERQHLYEAGQTSSKTGRRNICNSSIRAFTCRPFVGFFENGGKYLQHS